MGLLNSNVGYVYLVDSECRIRWAGSGHAWEGEVLGMNKAIERLLAEEETLRLRPSKAVSGAITEKSREVQRDTSAHKVPEKAMVEQIAPSAVAA
jgi:hypothetical protein